MLLWEDVRHPERPYACKKASELHKMLKYFIIHLKISYNRHVNSLGYLDEFGSSTCFVMDIADVPGRMTVALKGRARVGKYQNCTKRCHTA